MSEITNPQLKKVYSAATSAEQAAAYDDWAERYDVDLMSYGFRLPTVGAAVVARHAEPGAGPVLDAGCGTGLQAEPLVLLGCGPITGIDLSTGMLAVARRKGIYDSVRRMTLGEPLDFADDSFALTMTFGCITPGHAPASAFDELIRVTRPGAPVIFSLRVDAGRDPSHAETVENHAASGSWQRVFATAPFVAMPFGEPEVESQVFVYRVAG
jgi:SAM-dependent methyltransferase